jgi:dienelactone hydrolase
MRRLALALAALLLAAPAAGQTLVAGYDDRPAQGPATASGAVIYSPGLVRDGDPIETTPYVLDDLAAAGWDVFRFRRPDAPDTLESSIAALREAVTKLRADGYRRVVLAGQSFGAWISLAAARPEASPVDAVVALAPAAFGRRDEAPIWTQNADALYPLADTVVAGRVLVFLFADDAYDPGGRALRLRAIFERRQIAAEVIDRPHELAGHNAGLSAAFARRFGGCLRDFIQSAEAAPLFVCPDPGGARLAALEAAPSPALPPPDVDPALAAMGGRWYGVYGTGRDVLLSVAPTGPATASAVYAFGPVVRGIDSPAGSTRRSGRFDAATAILRFAEPQAATVIECRLLADDVMELAIAGRARGERLRAVLRRVE